MNPATLPERVLDTLERLTTRLEQHGIEYRIIGGLAVYRHGYERSTRDIDLLVDPQGYEQARAVLIGKGFLPRSERSKGLQDTATSVGVDFLIAGVDRPGSRRAPCAFPDPAGLTAVTGELPGRYVDLATLIDLKLLSATYGRTRQKDSIDILELLRQGSVPREMRERLHPEVRGVFDYWWRQARITEDDSTADHVGEPVSPYFQQAAAQLDRGEISVEQAVRMLKLEQPATE